MLSNEKNYTITYISSIQFLSMVVRRAPFSLKLEERLYI
ncbi:hypothetical protein WG66_013249 [Moniliophthora roreri]|nr:hypothetical protein WG66_013249 [Moniliophthora roreri]